MKIRCKNCYKELKENEEYCTFCGEHSEQIKRAMETGDYGPDGAFLLKTSLIIFAILAFLGSGIFLTVFAVVKDNVTQSFISKGNALFFTSIITFIAISLICRKVYIDCLWNDDLMKIVYVLPLAILFIGIVTLLSKLFNFTQVIPLFISQYLKSPTCSFSSGFPNATYIFIALVFAYLLEELLRRLFIDYFDEYTMLSDLWIMLISSSCLTILSFAHMMSPEVLIVSFITNLFLSGIYMNTDRSLGLNVLIKVLIIVIQFVIFTN